jgi:hypothetical protein
MNNKTIALCTMEKFDNRMFNSVGSSRIRMRWMLPYWDEAEEYVIGKKYDIMIFQKVYWPKMMDEFEGVKILDLCDPDWLENKPVFMFVDKVDAVTTSTQALADYVQKLRPDALVKCIPDRCYLPESKPIKTEFNDEIKKLVWFGYSHNAHYLNSVYEELIRRGLELVIVSESPIEPPLMYRGKIKIHNVAFNYESLNREMIKYDAILLPDPYGDERAKYKSNNKTLQAWALGMPVIKVPEDLDRLASKEARMKESQMRLQEIKDKWDVRYSVDEYKALIEEIKARKNK